MSDSAIGEAPCPCGSRMPYGACCGPIHSGAAAGSAAELMRWRFSAFALGLPQYLLDSWHPDNRPASLDLNDGTEWRRLQIVDTVAGGPGDDTGIVEFRASFRSPDGGGVLHERSRFTRVDGRWRYVDGELLRP